MTLSNLLQKEEIPSVAFPKGEVLHDAAAIADRNRQLSRALALGNLEHHKVIIGFLDASGRRCRVETTIWALTDEFVCLKGSILLPRHAILFVD